MPHPSTADVLNGQRLDGRLAIVTGGSGGIGRATAAALAGAGAEVLIAARAGAKLDAAAAALREHATAPVHAVAADLAVPAEVDRLADAVLALDRPVDMLVANAGVIGPLARTADGIELGLATNVVSHALLASRLRERVRAGSRIVLLSSFGHHYSPMVFDDPNFLHRPYSAWLSYGQSKTGCSLLAVKLSAAWRDRGVDAFAVHPGAIATEMSRSMSAEDHATFVETSGALSEADFKTPDEGAATTVWGLFAPELAGRGGLYLQDCAVAEVIDSPNYRSGVMRHAIDPAAADRLWALIETLAGRTLPL